MEVLCDTLNRQLDKVLSSGFHSELSKTHQEYSTEIQVLIDQYLLNSCGPIGDPVLVEPRIPFEAQLGLLGINLDPSVLYTPKTHKDKPYVAVVRNIRMDDVIYGGFNLKDVVDCLGVGMRPATPLEGVVNFGEILSGGFVVLPGGLYESNGYRFDKEHKYRYLCLDKYFGSPRITQVYRDSSDLLVGVLATSGSFK